jgi:hypothetical protein
MKIQCQGNIVRIMLALDNPLGLDKGFNPDQTDKEVAKRQERRA